MALLLAAMLAVGACWAVSGWYLWSAARGRKPRTRILWKLLAAAFALALGVAARTVDQQLRTEAVWRGDGLVQLALLLLALVVPFAIAVVSLKESD